MKLLRTIPWFTRVLVGLFLAAQFAGMVSLPRANALTVAGASVVHSHPDASKTHHYTEGHGHHGMPCGHHDDSGNPAEGCCALHACFAGLLPPVVAIATETLVGEPLSAVPDDGAPGAPGGRLDRPPRPLH